MSDTIDTKKIYDNLKDFQKDTVEFAYKGLKNNGRYLVADEVGLGKTMVAKGIIAKTYDELKNKKDNVEIVYITTNQSIASQNIETLKIGNTKTKTKRLSLLVTTLDGEDTPISFRSFTVGTSLEFKGSSTGLKEEREFLIYLLKKTGLVKRLHNNTLDTFFKQTANEVNTFREFTIPKGFDDIFKSLVKNNFTNLKEQISSHANNSSTIIKKLRKLLVIANLKYLNPDLIILDEFQRFSKLLTDEDYEDKEIIEILFNTENTHSKTLLLSATPYKLLDCKNNEHYDEFYNLIGWLYNNNLKIVNNLENLFNMLTSNLTNKEEIEKILKKVMCRTERYSFKEDNFEEWKIKNLKLKSTMKYYLKEYSKYSNLNIQGATRYLKSAPSALNYMKEAGYVTKREFLKLSDKAKSNITENTKHPKLQMLNQEVSNQKLKELIWMPPLTPYVKINSISNSEATKILIFSQWDFVPDSIVGSFSRKASKTNYTDKKLFTNREKLLFITKHNNPYNYDDVMTFSELIKKTKREYQISEQEAKILLGSPANVIYRSILKYGNIDNLEILKFYIEPYEEENTDWKSFSHLFLHHLGKKENYDLMNIEKNENNKLEKILDYCIKNNIQSIFDEYFHLLTDSPRYKNIQEDEEKMLYLLDIFQTIFTMRPNEVACDKYKNNVNTSIKKISKFAMRISKSSMSARANSEKPLTSDNVKISFNSPFAPFILATTSIGQEGLDFHPYCNQIWHWDLPSNPVDLEQREGRINRYKNYAVRKNIAKSFKNKCWIEKFEEAKKEKGCDFTTFWLYTSKNARVKIQRVIPLLPLSKEYYRYQHLKSQLKLYRSVMGQKKQKEKLRDNDDLKVIEISLKPSTLLKEAGDD